MRAKQSANAGLTKLYWFLILSAVILLALAAGLWIYDDWLYHR